MIDFSFCVQCALKKKILSYSKVFNKSRIQSHDIWMILPEELSILFDVQNIREIKTGFIVPSESMFREGKFIKINNEVINEEIGLHTYELTMKNQITNDLFYCYAQYSIQDDNPDTPYIYMNREDE